MKRIGSAIPALCFAVVALWLQACAPAGFGSANPASQPGYSRAWGPPTGQNPTPHLSAGSLTDLQLGEQLTDYLHAHRLPLVGAQAYTDASGSRQVVLYGYVATSFGQNDAADKTRSLIGDPNIAIANRIKIDPSLMVANGAPAQPSDNAGADTSGAQIPSPPPMGSAQAYQSQGGGYPGYGGGQASSYQQQQQQQNPQDWMTKLLPMLMGGGGFSSGGGMGGFGGMGFPNSFGSTSPYGSANPYPTAPYPGGYPAPSSPFFP